MQIVGFVVSPQHRYDGRPADGARPETADEAPKRIELRAGLGIIGDRYFGTRHRHASVTLISADEVEAVLGDIEARLTRRNIIVRGIDVEALVHKEFWLDTGSGPVRFGSLTRANPCAWMDEAFGTGARAALRGHAGIRAEPLSDGELALGPVTLGGITDAQRPTESRPARSAASPAKQP